MTKAPTAVPQWMAQGREKRDRVQKMFGDISDRYDLLNSLISARLHYRWRALATEKLLLFKGAQVLDLCCGTGVSAEPLKRKIGPDGRLIGLDFALPMLQVASRHRSALGSYALGDALHVPLASGGLDGVCVGWGIRNVIDIDAAHREVFRVLRPGKRFVSIDTAVPRNRLINFASRLVFRTVVPFLGKFYGKGKDYLYLAKSTELFKSREELLRSMESAGFIKVGWQDLMLGNICIHWGEKP